MNEVYLFKILREEIEYIKKSYPDKEIEINLEELDKDVNVKADEFL